MRRIAGLALLACFAALPAAAQKIYVAFGDSITFGYLPTPTPDPTASYPAQLQSLLAARGLTDTVRNAGLNGESTIDGLTRINSVLAGGGNVLLLMEGTNDINAKTISNETILYDLDQIAKKAEAQGWTVVHAPVIPRLPSAGHDADNAIASDLAARLRELSYQSGRRLADPFEVFITTPNVYNTLYSGGSDKLHPNAAGYRRLAEVFRDVLVGLDTVPPVPGAYSPANGATDAPELGPFSATIYDFGQGIDTSKAALLFNGQAVNATPTGDAKKLTLTYTPAAAVHGSITMSVRASDLNIPANSGEHVLATFVTTGTTFVPGDLNRDGRVDGLDLVRMAVAFGARRGETRFVAAADLNGDNVIDGSDFAVLAANFGRSSF